MTSSPDEIAARVLASLDGEALLRAIGHRPETIQRIGETLKAFCPIHREQVTRSLAVDLVRRRYVCSARHCPGHAGGDLLDLYARSRRIAPDVAALELAGSFGVEIDPGIVDRHVERALEVGENYFQMGTMDEAEREFEGILRLRPATLPALRRLVQIYRERGLAEKLTGATLRLARVLADEGADAEAADLLESYVRYGGGDFEARRLYIDCLRKLERHEEVAAEYSSIAESLTSAGRIDDALQIYRRIQAMGAAGGAAAADVSGQIVQVLLQAGRREEAVAEMLTRARGLAAAGRVGRAAESLLGALAIAPEDDGIRVAYAELVGKHRLAGRPLDEACSMVLHLLKAGARGPASRALDALVEGFPENVRPLELRADLEEARGHREAAVETRMRVVELFESRGDHAAALPRLERLIHEAPENLSLLSRRAETLRALGRTDDAREAYLDVVARLEFAGEHLEAAAACQTAIDLAPDQVAPRQRQFELAMRAGSEALVVQKGVELGSFLLERRDPSAAARALEAAMAVGGDSSELLRLHARALESLGRRHEAAEQHLAAARILAEREADAEALDCLEEALRCMPEHMEARERRADLRVKMGQTAQALGDYLELAHLDLRAGEWQGTLRVAQKALMVQPENLAMLQLVVGAHDRAGRMDLKRETQMRMASLMRRERAYTRASDVCEAILAEDEDNVSALEELVAIAEATKRTDHQVDALWRLALAHGRAGRRDEERRAIAETLKRRPLHVEATRRELELVGRWGSPQDLAHAVLGAIERFVQAHRPEDALHVFEALRRGESARPEVLAGLVRLYRLREDWDGVKDALRAQAESLAGALRDAEAIDTLGRLARMLPEDMGVRRRRIELMLRSDQRRAAAEEHRAVAEFYRRNRQFEAAEVNYKEVLALLPEDRAAREALIGLHLENQHHEEARREIETLAALETRREDYDAATRAYERVFEFDPKNEEATTRIIALRRRAGDVPGALRWYDRLLDVYLEDGRSGAFEQAAHEAIALAPDNWKMRRRLTDRLIEAGRASEAEAALVDTGAAQIKAGALNEAEATSNRILEINKDSVRGRALRAEILARKGDKDAALAGFIELAAGLADMRMSSLGQPATPFAFGNYEGLTRVREYTFDQFVVGSRNNFAHAAAQAVARAPGKNYNPLFIYADVGLGKTHLCHAIANHVLEEHPSLKVLYTMTEDFVEGLVDAIGNNAVQQFRNRHRLTDVLIVDDVQFLSGKERAQEEFFHVFNALFEGGKQIVITSDRPPKNIAHLEKRLRSRFGAGVIVDIQAPDLETRIAIVRRELIQRGRNHEVDDAAAYALAEAVSTNIRDLKGALVQILARHDMTREPIGPDLVQQVVDRVLDRV